MYYENEKFQSSLKPWNQNENTANKHINIIGNLW